MLTLVRWSATDPAYGHGSVIRFWPQDIVRCDSLSSLTGAFDFVCGCLTIHELEKSALVNYCVQRCDTELLYYCSAMWAFFKWWTLFMFHLSIWCMAFIFKFALAYMTRPVCWQPFGAYVTASNFNVFSARKAPNNIRSVLQCGKWWKTPCHIIDLRPDKSCTFGLHHWSTFNWLIESTFTSLRLPWWNMAYPISTCKLFALEVLFSSWFAPVVAQSRAGEACKTVDFFSY